MADPRIAKLKSEIDWINLTIKSPKTPDVVKTTLKRELDEKQRQVILLETKTTRDKIREVRNQIVADLPELEANWLLGYIKGRVDEMVRTEGEDTDKTAEQRFEILKMLLENKEVLQEKAKRWGQGMRKFGRDIGKMEEII